ncbi:hypothetical protein C7S17_4109 [Burkholderia thailandensis]|nr:hypothetical protein [Burkholderia thailandensis]
MLGAAPASSRAGFRGVPLRRRWVGRGGRVRFAGVAHRSSPWFAPFRLFPSGLSAFGFLRLSSFRLASLDA